MDFYLESPMKIEERLNVLDRRVSCTNGVCKLLEPEATMSIK